MQNDSNGVQVETTTEDALGANWLATSAMIQFDFPQKVSKATYEWFYKVAIRISDDDFIDHVATSKLDEAKLDEMELE